MYNVRVIKYPTGCQVKVYDMVLGVPAEEKVNIYTGEVIERKKRVEFEPDTWYASECEFEELEELFEEQEEERRRESARISANRTKNNIYYLARSNVWEWFVTLTLSPEKIDRYDYKVCSKAVRVWLNHLRRKAPDLYYLFVPEQHKDGAWHFHGLIGGCTGLTFTDSGKYTDEGEKVFNLEDFKLGFSTATPVQDTGRASSYICKYVTKDLCYNTSGRQRYWVSNNVQRAQVYEAVVPVMQMRDFRIGLFEHMLWKKKVCSEFLDVEYFEVGLDWDGIDIQEV